MASDADQNHKTKEPEETCFHDYAEHLKHLQGGDCAPFFTDKRFSFKYPSGSELAAFLDIGAEAERRNELQFQEMKSCIEKLTKENDCLRKENKTKTNAANSLQKKIAENESVIMSLTSEIDDLNCSLTDSSIAKNLNATYECEREKLLKDKETLCWHLKRLKWKFSKLKEKHDYCPTKEQIKVKDCKIHYLCEDLKEKEGRIDNVCSELKDVQEKKQLLELKVKSLEDQLQAQYDHFTEKGCTYEKTIEDLESQITFLEQSLNDNGYKTRSKDYVSNLRDRTYDPCRVYYIDPCREFLYDPCREFLYDPCRGSPSDPCHLETEKDICKNDKKEKKDNKKTSKEKVCKPLSETYTANKICERDRILQELVAKIELRDKNIQQLTKLQNCLDLVSNKEYNQLVKLIDEQTCDIDRLTDELQNKSLDDTDSVELLKEVAELQNAVHCPSICDPQGIDPLVRRIKRIRCKIKSRLQREEARKKELSRQLGIYRCHFSTLQKEIDELRQANAPSTKDDIRLRLDKEKALCQIICHVNRQRRDLSTKCTSLTKALANIEKVNEFLMHLT